MSAFALHFDVFFLKKATTTDLEIPQGYHFFILYYSTPVTKTGRQKQYTNWLLIGLLLDLKLL